eukprot:TRINITY_DN647_c0_g1_i1.p1 TRINITY_DN647_c0_g1~~TRINITY_DN647_c0_g1_i1.p1  ORF type:complete len:595 (-),score=176.23 TRINITY_DN647_c0_g1_i1:49-1833(-)
MSSLKNIFSPAPSTTRGKPVVISNDPKGNNFLYTCGNAVVIKNIKDPLVADIYYEHAHPATVAKYAPSGFYIASGDAAGNLRIWDTTQLEHPLKIELKVLSGAVADIAWSSDNQRLIVVGDGKERFGAALLWDSGASVGEISGHSKPIISCDFKSSRPFRVATGSEDLQTNWFEGPPFKFNKKHTDHTRFVNCVRFSPDGNKMLTVGADKKGFFYDGKTGDKIGELQGEHALGIYGCAWSPDSKKVLTVSADKTAKIWDDTGKLLQTFTFEGGVEQQVLGCLWQGEHLLTVNLNGDVTYLDAAKGGVSKVLKGHNKLITSLAFDPSNKRIYSGSYDANILSWDVSTGIANSLTGQGHTNSITSMVVEGGNLVTISMDDTLRVTPVAGGAYGAASLKFDSQPQALAVNKDVSIVATLNSIVVVKGTTAAATLPVSYQPTSVGISPNASEVIVGGKDNKLYVYSLAGNALKETKVLTDHRGTPTAVTYSPDGKWIATADTNRDIFVWDSATKALKIQGWVFHNAKVTSLAWNPNSKYIVSGSLDSHVIVWSVDEPSKRIQQKTAHPGGVNAVLWIDDKTVASAGLDCSIKAWNIKF